MHATSPLPPPPPEPAAARPHRPPGPVGGEPPPTRPRPPAGDGSPDASRTGAVWVTATGAFLLLAAATLFVAVRWDQLGDPARLGILGAATGGSLLAGRALRPGLPATSRVLSHLGALLVPLVVAAVALDLTAGAGGTAPWAPVLAITAATATVAWWALARSEDLPLLRPAAAAAVVPAVAGLAGTAGVSAPLLLVGLAAGAEVVRTTSPQAPIARGARRCALTWSLVAGLGPALAAAAHVAGVDRLAVGTGVDGADGAAAAVATGLAAAVVLARSARAAGQPALLLAAAAVAALGLTTGQAEVALGLPTLVLAAAGAVLVLELTALALRTDPFWGRPAHLAAVAAEVAAIGLPALLLLATVDASLHVVHRPVLAGAGALGVAAWLVADLRRTAVDRALGPWQLLVGGGWAPATVGAAATVVAGTVAATGQPLIIGSTLLVLSVVLVTSGRPLAAAVAVVGTTSGTLLLAEAHAGAGLGAGLAGAATLAWAAALRRPLGGPDDEPRAWLLAGWAALVPLLALPAAVAGVGMLVALPTTVAALGLAAWIADGGRRGATAPLGHPLRGVAVVVVGLAAAAGLVEGTRTAPTEAGAAVALAAALAAALLVADAVRRDDPVTAAGLASVVPAGLVGGLWALGWTTPAVGLALCALAVVATGTHLVVGRTWAVAAAGTAAVAAAAGSLAAAGDPAAAATGWILVGGAVLVAATGHRRSDLAVVGAALTTVGCWSHLELADVSALDAWVAPVAAALVIAGIVSRHPGMSSWAAYGPAVALLGGTAVVERWAGGGGVHALVAGAVGIAAVVAGGARRLAAPLVLGTGVLVILVVQESLAYTAGVPTWAWLAAGGALLVGTGVGLERHATGPFEAGQRLVDVVRRRYR